MYLNVENLTKKYGDFTALDAVSVGVQAHEFVCLLGPSGCGKTTLLRIIAGRADADGGEVSLESQNLMGLPARQRGFGIVFQSYSLLPNMTVAENNGYGLNIGGPDKNAIPAPLGGLLQNIELPDICIGYDEENVDMALVKILKEEFQNFKVSINSPYSGSMMPGRFSGNDNVKSVMIEINKRLYLNADNRKSDDFMKIHFILDMLMSSLIYQENYRK